MPKALVTAGNVFDPTFDGVCYAVKTTLGEINLIHIFDTIESATQAESTQRNARIREILGKIDITTSLVNDESIQTIVPDRLARLIRDFGTNEIIVDLSNGQKVTTAVLYAVSTISRIPNIYALEFYVRPTKDTRIADLDYPKEWSYTQIQPLREIISITQSSYVELVYYRDRVEQIFSLLSNKDYNFALDVKDKLEHSLVDYFTLSSSTHGTPERLERCVNGLGKICEDVARIWHSYCLLHGMVKGGDTKFATRSKQIVSAWERYRSDASDGKLDLSNKSIMNGVLPTFVTDMHLEAMRVYRNLASHSTRHYECSKQDARLAMDLTLMILERLAQSEIIGTPEKEA